MSKRRRKTRGWTLAGALVDGDPRMPAAALAHDIAEIKQAAQYFADIRKIGGAVGSGIANDNAGPRAP